MSALIPEIFVEPIPAHSRGERRQAESRAVGTLVERVFGPDARYCHHPSGEPYIEGRGEYVSVSHSAALAVMAVSEVRVGVDVEEWRPQLRRIAGKILTPEEPSAERLTDDELLKMWTAKEAAFKCAADESLTVSVITVDLDAQTATLPSGKILSLRFSRLGDSVIALAI